MILKAFWRVNLMWRLNISAKFEKADNTEAYELWLTESSKNFVNNFYDQNDYLKPF